MKVYKFLALNKIREKVRLIRNMYIPIVGLIIFLAMVLSVIGKDFFNIIKSIKMFDSKIYFISFLCMLASIICKMRKNSMPQIVVKPMTLYLFNTRKIRDVFVLKYAFFVIKYVLLSLLLAFCTCGSFQSNKYVMVFGGYTIYLIEGLLVSWNIYNVIKQSYIYIWKAIFVFLSILTLTSCTSVIIEFINLVCMILIFIYTAKYLNINYLKYENDIKYLDKVLVAQNNNDTILLNQYSKEKIARKLYGKEYMPDFLKKYPLVWKAVISISRIGKLPIIIGIVCFSLTFMIYTLPVFWSIPVLEFKEIRYFLLIFGVFSLFQFSIQAFFKQLSDLVEKQKNGLYIPFKLSKIILQFSIIPTIYIIIMSVIVTILLKSRIYLSIIFGVIMVMYIWITMYFGIKNKNLLNKIYTVLSIIVFLLSSILMIK